VRLSCSLGTVPPHRTAGLGRRLAFEFLDECLCLTGHGCRARSDPGKKVNGRKRFIVTDTLGLLLTVVVVTAAVQDRDGAKPVLLETYLGTSVRFVFADGAFAGRLLDWAYTVLRTTLHIMRKPTGQRGFAVIPRRWAVERTFAWLTAHRRLARDYERDPAVSEAMIRWAAINTITRRLARGAPATRQQQRTFTPTS
jgi:transposase